MNIWALDKHVAIKHLLLLLADHFPEKCFEIENVTELPGSAVRLCSLELPSLSVYIYIHGQPEDRFGIHLEYPPLDETPVSNTVDMLENVSFDRLAELLSMHFGCIETA